MSGSKDNQKGELFKRKSSRLANKHFGVKEGPLHFDLTQEDSPTVQSPAKMAEPSSGKLFSSPRKLSSDDQVEILRKNLEEFQKLKKAAVSERFMRIFLFELGFETEEELEATFREVSQIQSEVEKEHAEKSSGMDDETDEHEIVIHNFRPKMGVVASVSGSGKSLFRNIDHRVQYEWLLSRGVVSPRHFDFDLLDALCLNIREKLKMLQLEDFCSDDTNGYSELTAYFYSNLSFISHEEVSFSVEDKNYTLTVERLAEILKVEHKPFIPIRASKKEIFSFFSKKKSQKKQGRVTYDVLTSQQKILHKILINCIRPRAGSVTDVSHIEARLIYGIEKQLDISLPYCILLHMYSVIGKDKGQLPYASLICRIFASFKIPMIPSLDESLLQNQSMGMAALKKMKFNDLSDKLAVLEKEGFRSAYASKRKVAGDRDEIRKKRKGNLLIDEDSDDDRKAFASVPPLIKKKKMVTEKSPIGTSDIAEEIIPSPIAVTEPILETGGVEKVSGEEESVHTPEASHVVEDSKEENEEEDSGPDSESPIVGNLPGTDQIIPGERHEDNLSAAGGNSEGKDVSTPQVSSKPESSSKNQSQIFSESLEQCEIFKKLIQRISAVEENQTILHATLTQMGAHQDKAIKTMESLLARVKAVENAFSAEMDHLSKDLNGQLDQVQKDISLCLSKIEETDKDLNNLQIVKRTRQI